MPTSTQIPERADIVMVGAGIMSATLATLLKELEPSLKIVVLETLKDCAQESSNGWNNAGTGHAANCEMNYTPARSDGTVDISKALEVNTEFDISRQLWAYLVKKGAIPNPQAFINPCPHMSFVWGEDNVNYLRQRFKQMSSHHCYHGMEYSEDPAQIEQWTPLIMEGRSDGEPVAATRIVSGSDVDYGALTHLLFDHLSQQSGFEIHYLKHVQDITRQNDNRWCVEMHDTHSKHHESIQAGFVFIGAGGGAIELLQKSGIPEGHGYGGFPVSGIWLRCDIDSISERHHAKVYGKAAHGSPPMSVPHLDTRLIGDKKSLLFGPYAGFSSRFLKQGSLTDMFRSVRPDNVLPMLDVAKDNWQLTEYLVSQVLQSKSHQFEMLRQYYPMARHHDWTHAVAGQRVQIIKPSHEKAGVLEFGTELIASSNHSLAALLGASPGASTAAFIALEVLEKCFADKLTDDGWLPQLKTIIPTYGIDLKTDKEACYDTRKQTAATLNLDFV
ncbi:malate dehydrogenase (quinone) [Halomonas citrativorans]|uniref:Probable malate:quinone oxidoreductase n=1 Tax=Halomonas citrativorans TaxID=2742612 RepID=A0ABR9FE28_9GAMM|nr:malate dehydrogenase (quinone) [Halomonas citrativorans]MBE0404574.1 malate dehydrogenase (quinone) [Halomonas citrativorans]